MLQSRNSIHEIELVYGTGERPVLVTCDDIKDWVCKYRSTSQLTNEILGSQFAKCWNLKTPEIGLINVLENHLPQKHLNIVQPRFFKKPCFGSLKLEHCKEIDDSIILLLKNKNNRRKIRDKTDFLKIAFFDIWLANEDRNYNNSNLLLDFTNGNQYEFYVFDHGNIFNTNSLNHGITSITEDDSLIKTPLAKLLFKRGNKLTEIVNNLVENFYLCTTECNNNLNSIVNQIPPEWEMIDLEKTLKNQIFTDEWLKECETNFRTFIQANL